MKPRFLFPHSWKKWGWIITILGLIPGISVGFFNNNLGIFEIGTIKNGSISDLLSGGFPPGNLSATIAGVLLIIGLVLVAFSQTKREDEFISQVRLESLQWAVYVNYALLLLAFLLTYGGIFLSVMVYDMFTVLIIFIIRFHWILYRQKRLLQDEK